MLRKFYHSIFAAVLTRYIDTSKMILEELFYSELVPVSC